MKKAYHQYHDEHLLPLIASDDEQAFHALYDRYWKKLLVQALIKTGSPGTAEEIVQTVFINLWRRRHTLRVRFTLATYLASMLKYEIISHLAREKKEQALKQKLFSHQQAEDHSTVEWLDYEQLREDIERAIATLPEKCRLVFRLSREEGLSGKQIASSLDISPKTVEAHINKALKVLGASLRQLTSLF
ncbi:MAG TPA: RNA polymerase sigma-70 factor [Puia sp.]|nr:RNA polymerase sigma-70 factor [Puia sp.]